MDINEVKGRIEEVARAMIKSNLHIMTKLSIVECELQNTQELLVRMFSDSRQTRRNLKTIQGNFSDFRYANDEFDKLIDEMELDVTNTDKFMELLKQETAPPTAEEKKKAFCNFANSLKTSGGGDK